MKVITKTNPNGGVGYCTARCYNSTRKKCNCICKGLLHGKGDSLAKRQAPTAAMYLQLRDRDGSKYFPAPELIPDTGGR